MGVRTLSLAEAAQPFADLYNDYEADGFGRYEDEHKLAGRPEPDGAKIVYGDCRRVAEALDAGGLQTRCLEWSREAFPGDFSGEKPQEFHVLVRALRHVEEAVELAQSVGLPLEKVLEQARHTYSRDIGEPSQEVAGSLLTLFALASAIKVDAMAMGEKELALMWGKIPQIREKSKHKVKVSA
jgi:hypothetical protein